MELRMTVMPEGGADPDDASPWLDGLGEELADLNGIDVGREFGVPPNNAKSTGYLAALIVYGPSKGISAVLQFVRGWVARTNRSIEVSLDGDVIKITGASQDQQDRVIEAWLVHHASRP